MIDANNYKKHLESGKAVEEAVTLAGAMLGFSVIRNDGNNKSDPDLKVSFELDVKKRVIPFRRSFHYLGIEPEQALPINVRKLQKYIKRPNMHLLFYVDYRPENGTHGLYTISGKRLKIIYEQNYKTRIHSYQTRREGEENAASSFYLLVDECSELPGLFFDVVKREIESELKHHIRLRDAAQRGKVKTFDKML